MKAWLNTGKARGYTIIICALLSILTARIDALVFHWVYLPGVVEGSVMWRLVKPEHVIGYLLTPPGAVLTGLFVAVILIGLCAAFCGEPKE